MNHVVTFGEAMVRLAPPGFRRLESAMSLDVEIGGAELNTAAGLVKLGIEASWVSAVAENPLGRLVRAGVRAAGVDDTFVVSKIGRCGLYFLEPAAAPRPAAVTYDRADSAFSAIWPTDFDWDDILTGAAWFHVTGITPAVSDPIVTKAALLACRRHCVPVSFDLNFRATLWPVKRATTVLSDLLSLVDTLIAGEADAELLFDIKGPDFETVAKLLAEKFGCKRVATVRREAPVAWRNKYGMVGWSEPTGLIETPLYECEVVDRLGAGDAAAAGLIAGLLQNDYSRGLHLGAACGALKHTVPGDLPQATVAEAEAVLSGAGLRVKR